jgi:hypothetical protein
MEYANKIHIIHSFPDLVRSSVLTSLLLMPLVLHAHGLRHTHIFLKDVFINTLLFYFILLLSFYINVIHLQTKAYAKIQHHNLQQHFEKQLHN